MRTGGIQVPYDSPKYREFERLYLAAQAIEPTGVDRWNRELHVATGDQWGGFQPVTGRITVSADLVLRHLDGHGASSRPDERAQALATVLHEATHAGMPTDAADRPNAVRTRHSLGLMEGFAEVRVLEDFSLFAAKAGYSGLDLPTPEYPAAHAAAHELMKYSAGSRKTWNTLITEGTHGPGVMHFDQLADGVLRNRLADVVPDSVRERQAVRAILVDAMTHPGWLVLPELHEARLGQAVATDIRRELDAKVAEIRQRYRPAGASVESVGGAEVGRGAGDGVAGLPPPDARDRIELRGPGAGRGPEGPADGRGVGGAADGRGAGGAAYSGGRGGGARFLDGQAPAAGAVARRPRLGMGERGAGRPGREPGGRPGRE